jgi:murein DD-endopeptidase MepM/ murein hydrolase activator NlpD
MRWEPVAIPLLTAAAIAAFGVLLASEGLVQTRNTRGLDSERFYQLARAGEGEAAAAPWGGPVASWEDAGQARLRGRPVPIEQSRAEERFVLPLAGWWGLTDRFGEPRGEDGYHTGLDIGLAGWEASPVYSACDGIVLVAENHATYGNYVVVDCGDGWSTVSAHFSEIAVSAGDEVAAGSSILGLSGSTGLSTGEHLHFEVRYEGVPIDPELVLVWE